MYQVLKDLVKESETKIIKDVSELIEIGQNSKSNQTIEYKYELLLDAGKIEVKNGKYRVVKSLKDVLDYWDKQNITYTINLIFENIMKKSGKQFPIKTVGQLFSKEYRKSLNGRAKKTKNIW